MCPMHCKCWILLIDFLIGLQLFWVYFLKRREKIISEIPCNMGGGSNKGSKYWDHNLGLDALCMITEGPGGGEGETQLVLVPPATFDGSQVVYSYRCTKRLHALTGKAESSNEKIQWLSAAVNSQQTPAETAYSQICSSGSWSAFVTVVVIKVEF